MSSGRIGLVWLPKRRIVDLNAAFEASESGICTGSEIGRGKGEEGFLNAGEAGAAAAGAAAKTRAFRRTRRAEFVELRGLVAAKGFSEGLSGGKVHASLPRRPGCVCGGASGGGSGRSGDWEWKKSCGELICEV